MTDLDLKTELNKRFDKNELIKAINSSPQTFEQAMQLTLGTDINISWRAAWVVKQAVTKDDIRLLPYQYKIIEAIKSSNKDGHQRELLKLLAKIEIDKDAEGYLFDICLDIWEKINKIPSVRITAFETICKIAQNYPELKKEILILTNSDYTDTLSKGIMKSFDRLKSSLLK